MRDSARSHYTSIALSLVSWSSVLGLVLLSIESSLPSVLSASEPKQATPGVVSSLDNIMIRPPADGPSETDIADPVRRNPHNVSRAQIGQHSVAAATMSRATGSSTASPLSTGPVPQRLPPTQTSKIPRVAQLQSSQKIETRTPNALTGIEHFVLQRTGSSPQPVAEETDSRLIASPTLDPDLLTVPPRHAGFVRTRNSVWFYGLRQSPSADAKAAWPPVDDDPRSRNPHSVRRNSGQIDWQTQHTRWSSTNLSYAPLYFEDPRLERHGHDLGLVQPCVSGIRFFGTVAALPYLMTTQNPRSTVYPLGQTRPGDYIAPYHAHPRFNLRGSLVTAVTWLGWIALLP